jgi:LuxR family transcriptional regulator, maltose regulon positive regulatory protein
VYDAELPPRSRWLLGGCRALGTAHLLLGNLVDAVTVFTEGIRLAGGDDRTAYAEAHCHGLLAFAHLDRRELDRAEARVAQARVLIERNGLETTFEAMAPGAADAIVAFRRGDPARARRLMHLVAARLSVADAAPWYKGLLAIRLGELAVDLDDPAAAGQLATVAEQTLALIPDAGTLPARLDQLASTLGQQTGEYATLTPAERRVLVQLATHKTLAEIGKTLYVSRTTVKSHVSSIYSKLGVTTRNEAVARLPRTTSSAP